MVFNTRLPATRTLRYLAEMAGPFPIKSGHLVLAAERLWFGDNVVAFLKLFPADGVFRSRDDFIERCKQLELIILAERDAPIEALHSPQG